MDRKRNEIARSLSMVTQLGISMLAPLILCVCVGIWLDDTFGWSTTAVLVVLGPVTLLLILETVRELARE